MTGENLASAQSYSAWLSELSQSCQSFWGSGCQPYGTITADPSSVSFLTVSSALFASSKGNTTARRWCSSGPRGRRRDLYRNGRRQARGLNTQGELRAHPRDRNDLSRRAVEALWRGYAETATKLFARTKFIAGIASECRHVGYSKRLTAGRPVKASFRKRKVIRCHAPEGNACLHILTSNDKWEAA